MMALKKGWLDIIERLYLKCSIKQVYPRCIVNLTLSSLCWVVINILYIKVNELSDGPVLLFFVFDCITPCNSTVNLQFCLCSRNLNHVMSRITGSYGYTDKRIYVPHLHFFSVKCLHVLCKAMQFPRTIFQSLLERNDCFISSLRKKHYCFILHSIPVSHLLQKSNAC